MSKSEETFHNTIMAAIENIERDREQSFELLLRVKEMLVGRDDFHGIGNTAAKYIEAMQRSNEQLIKVAKMAEKNAARQPEEEELDDSFFEGLNSELAEVGTKDG